ncbi:MAG TPA: nitronate monooxygenase [Mesorhizobium sp.]|jgi:nitronate monooxygenase|nr:nitronate monooxygenase [Mesorhizobium sp.]
MLRTSFTQMMEIDHPILLAPMGGSVSLELAVAVAQAGAFAMFGASWDTPEQLRASIAGFRAASARPFAVNLCLEWDQHERLEIALAEDVPVISLFWGDPKPYLAKIRSAGAKSMVTVGSAEEARRVADLGADIVVAQGVEAGGHVWSKVGTMVLVPAVVDAVTPLPVIAAGGIADGRGIAAALALGAAGAWMGTRFLATPEAQAAEDYKRHLIAACETDTVHTELFDLGWPRAPHRVIRNSTYEAWDGAGRPRSGERPGEGQPVAWQADGSPLLRYSDDTARPGATGNLEGTCLYAGQSVGLVRDILPAGELVRRLIAEAQSALSAVAFRAASSSK